MQRPALGLIAIVLIAIGFFTHGGSYETLSGSCLRVGAVTAVLWLAYPQLRSVPGWLVGTGAIGLLIVMRWPRLIVLALPLAGLLWLLWPRAPRAGAGQRRDSR